ncbi:MAG TPA: rod shape-determining protein MreC [Bacteroidia bacterium]|nr:rod shape-determining protein MreC [Bacteroidia bacterium]
MRNLLRFIARYHLFFTFLALEGIAFWIFMRHDHFQRSVFVNTSNQVTGQFYERVANVKEYFGLRQVNEELAKENARLLALLKESQYVDTSEFTLKNDTALRQKYLYIDAEVIRNTVNLKNNYLTLNRGSNHGVMAGMGVISSNGVVGMVYMVSPNFCTVISLLNSNTRIPPKIEDNDYFGTLTWEGKDPRYATLNEINMHVPVKEGQRVVTSGYSKVYPENIPIGVIEEKYVPPGENFYKIKVKLFTNFEALRKVYIVNNLLQAEQDSLETRSDIDAR